MASKFQNRLVGTTILVALGVILLPSLLDGDKKYYEETFASIPLVPKTGDEQGMDVMPSVTVPLSPQIAEEQHRLTEEKYPADPAIRAEPVTPPLLVERGHPPSLANPVSPPEQGGQVPILGEVKKRPETRLTETRKAAESAPVGQAYIVQLGALKNASKVDEIVATLRLSGYRVYTTPAQPVTGQLTRIYVGPDISRQKLQSQLGELQQLSGLSGQIKSYSPR